MPAVVDDVRRRRKTPRSAPSVRALDPISDRRELAMRQPTPVPPLVESLEGRALLSAYYVSPLGSDALAGTAAEPWRTLQKAASSVVPGDIVIVRPGAYSAGFHLTRSGTPAAPVTFHAEPGALITGRNAVTADAINLEGASHVVVEGFAIDNTSGTITRAGIRSVANTGVVIRNNRVDRPGRWGIFTG